MADNQPTLNLKPFKVRLTSLKYDDRNARHHTDRNIAAIKESLQAHGQVTPLLVRKSTKTVIAGNGTMKAMVELGRKHAEVVFLNIEENEAISLGLR